MPKNRRIKILAVKHDFDCTRIIAIGFADGANITGSILILSPDFFEGAILFRPKKPFENKRPLPDKFGTRIFISTGKNDETIKSEDTAIYLSFLENAGFKVTHHYLDAGHNLIKEDLGKILNVKTLNLQKTNVVEKGVGILTIEYQYLSAIKKYYSKI